MDKLGLSGTFGFALLMVLFVVALATFATIEPLKETLDNVRDSDALNCPDVAGFDATDYNNDTDFEKLVRRPTCFVTGMGMVWFIGSVLLAAVTWVVASWRKIVK